MIAFLLSFGFWFWGLIIVEFILLTWFVEQEWPAPSFASIIIFIVLLWWLADIPVWVWIKENPWRLTRYFGYYIILGVCWSFFKYYFQLKRTRKVLSRAKAEWTLRNQNTTEPITFQQFLNDSSGFYKIRKDLDFESSARKLIFWSMFWPTSMVWTLLNDPFRKLFKWLIFDVFVEIYRKMHKKMIGNLLEE